MLSSAQMFMEIFLVKGMFSEAVTEWRGGQRVLRLSEGLAAAGSHNPKK